MTKKAGKNMDGEEGVTTIGGLATLVMQEFGAVWQEMKEGFEDTNSQFRAMDNKIDALEQAVTHFRDNVEQSTRELKSMVHDHEIRLTRVERKVGA